MIKNTQLSFIQPFVSYLDNHRINHNESIHHSQYKLNSLVDKARKKNYLHKKNQYQDALLITSQIKSGQREVSQKLKTLKKRSQRNINQQYSEQIKNIKLPKIAVQQKQASLLLYPLYSIYGIKHQKLRSSSAYKTKIINKLTETLLQQQLRHKTNQYLQLQGYKMQHFQRKNDKRFQQRKKFENYDIQRRKSLVIQKLNKNDCTIIKKTRNLKKKKKQNLLFQYFIFLKLILYLNKVSDIQNPQRRYKFYVGQGNNSFLVRSVIRHRFWWTITNNWHEANFLWTQNKSKQYTQKLSCIEPHNQIDLQYQDIQVVDYPQISNFNDQFQTINPQIENSIILSSSLKKIDQKSIKLNKQQQVNYKQCLLKFMDQEKCKDMKKNQIQQFVKNMKKQNFAIIAEKSYNIHNHLQCHWMISNKKALFANMKKYYQQLKQDPFKSIPRTYHIKRINDPQYLSLQEYFKSNKNTWIIKPGENTNRGNGISLAQSWVQIQKLIILGCTNNKTLIIQQYIYPLLYHNRKFDIRCYMLVTSLNGKIKGYWYEQGYVRTASKQFNMNNINNKFIHLTNDAIQSRGEDYGKYQSYNKLSFKQLQKYFHQIKKDFDVAKNQMKQLAKQCIKSSFRKLDPKKRNFTFQIFGLDFLIDNKGKTWLIEVNTNPCLELSGNLLARIIPHMLQNSLRIGLDPIFKAPKYEEWAISRRVQYSKNIFSKNKYELIFDQNHQNDE